MFSPWLTSPRWYECFHTAFGCSSPDLGSRDEGPDFDDVGREDFGPPFEVTVDGFRLGQPVMFSMTVRRGDAVWRIRRRFRNIWAVHRALLLGCGRTALRSGLPSPPPRMTPRSVLFGPTDHHFLERRSKQIESYFRELLEFIPCVEQCEALYMFLCYVHLPRWEGDGTMIGGGAPPVDAKAVAKLPKAKKGIRWLTAPASTPICVICQDTLDAKDAKDGDADIRVLPCGHQFHFGCIAIWLKQRNTCCVCNGPAVLTAPHFEKI